jgi:Holliday junction resolvase RusA-like endonuclease
MSTDTLRDPVFTCFVPGIPSPGGSKVARLITRGNGEIVKNQSGRPLITMRDMGGEKTATWRNNVAFFARRELGPDRSILFPRGTPFALRIRFVMPRINSHFNSKGLLKANAPAYHTVKPDATKLLRSTEDALTGILWHDDAACMPSVRKEYGDTPGARIEVFAMVSPVVELVMEVGLFG